MLPDGDAGWIRLDTSAEIAAVGRGQRGEEKAPRLQTRGLNDQYQTRAL